MLLAYMHKRTCCFETHLANTRVRFDVLSGDYCHGGHTNSITELGRNRQNRQRNKTGTREKRERKIERDRRKRDEKEIRDCR